MGKPYRRAVRSDKEECVVNHQAILWAAAPWRPGLQKKDLGASKYVQQGYRAPIAAQQLPARPGSCI
jgi:hypothetical protein